MEERVEYGDRTSIKKYRKKPVVIEAIQYDGDNLNAVLNFCEGAAFTGDDEYVIIVTYEGNMTASVNDYIIKGVQGEFYPCKPDIFEETYDRC